VSTTLDREVGLAATLTLGSHAMSAEPVLAYARLNARILPLDRGERYEDPLAEALAGNGYAEITGGGTGQSENGEISYCGIDIDLLDVEKGVPFICEFLSERGAPKGSALEFERNGEKVEVPFGFLEGLAIYLNGTDLPDEVYQTCDVNELYEEIKRLLGDRGDIQGHWQGPTETALYLYGYSADEMKELIAGPLASYPLCQRARVERIA
jgi:hypothetical protein